MPDGAWCITRGIISVSWGFLSWPSLTQKKRAFLGRSQTGPPGPASTVRAGSHSLLAWPLLLFAAVDGKFYEAKAQFHHKTQTSGCQRTEPGGKKEKSKEKKRKEDDAITKPTWTGCSSDRLQPQVNRQLIWVVKHGQTGRTSSWSLFVFVVCVFGF